MAIRVAIVDDDQTVLDSLKRGFEAIPEFSCAGCYPGVSDALARVRFDQTDVVLMDLRMPEMSGIECTRQLKSAAPDLPVIVLAGHAEPQLFFHALIAGASGYLIKPVSLSDCVAAIREVLAGGAPLSREVARLLVGSFRGLPDHSRQMASLTDREREIMACLFNGYRDRRIAETLGIRPATVHTHMERIFDKLGVGSRADALTKYFHNSKPDQRA